MAAGYYAHRIDFDDLAGASIAFNLPFFQPKRLREKEAEKEAELSGARASLEGVKNEVRRAVAEAYADLERSIEQARLYRGSILPQAETNLAAAQEAYAVGQVDFLTYVRAALDRDMYEGDLVMRRAGAWRALAALQKASGLPLIEGTPKPGEIHVEK
jgi:outer membrane protein TolC